jgi:hypothetical protein
LVPLENIMPEAATAAAPPTPPPTNKSAPHTARAVYDGKSE